MKNRMSDKQLSDPNLNAIFQQGIQTQQDIKALSARFDKHSGEGEGTTHGMVDKRFAKHEKRLHHTEMRVYGFSLVFGLIVAKWKSLIGG